MSWSPQPTLGGALWSGNAPLVTSRQFISSISSINTTLSSLEFEIGILSTAARVSSVADWAVFPAAANINMINRDIYSTGLIVVSSITSISSIVTPALKTNTISSNTITTTTVNATTINGTINGTTNGPVNATTLNVSGAININGNNIGNFNGGTTTGSITLGSKNGIQENASTVINLLVDRGADVGGNAVIDLTAQYGGGSRVNLRAASASALAVLPTSQVNITADGNTTIAPTFVPVGGAVNITANAGFGTGTPVVGYGQIYLTANSFNTTTQPGFIAHAAGANAIYSGSFSPFAGLGQAYGNNYIWGQAGNSFVCSPTTPSFPAVVGSNYFYAFLGAALGPSGQIAGNRFRGGIAAEFIQPFPLYGDLYIQGDNAGNMIQISSVKVLNMSTSGAITGVGNINLSSINGGSYLSTIPTSLNISSLTVSSIITDNIGVITENVSSATISTLTAGRASISTLTVNGLTANIMGLITENVSSATISSLTAGAVTGVGNINLSSINGGPYLSTVVAPANINNNSVTTNSIYASTIVATAESRTSSFIVSSINNSAYPPPATPITSTFNNLYTSSFFVSSINGASYPPSAGAVSTFSTATISSLTAGTASISSLNVSSITGITLTGTSTFSTATVSSLTAGNTTTNLVDVTYTFLNTPRTGQDAGVVISTVFNQNYSSIISTANLSSYSKALQLLTSGTNMFITAGSIPTLVSPIYLTTANTPFTATTQANGQWFAPVNPSYNSVWVLYITGSTTATNFNIYTVNTNDQIWVSFPSALSFTFTGTPAIGTPYTGTIFQLSANNACNISWNLGAGTAVVNQLVTSQVEYSTVTNAITNFETDVYETVLTTKNTWTAGGVSTIYPGNLALTYSTIAIGGATARTNVYPIEIGASTRIAGQIVAQTGSISSLTVSSIIGIPATTVTSTFSTLTASTFTTGATTLTAPLGTYDFTKTLTLTSTTYDAVSSLYQSLVNYNYNLILTTEATNSIPYPPGGNSGSLSWSGLGTWASTINTVQQGLNAAITFALPSNQQPGYPATGTTDFYNSGQSSGLTLVYTGGSIATVPYLSTFRFTWTAATGTYGTWSYATSAPPYGTTNNTSFQINQNITNTNISTSDVLTLTGTSININGPLTANNATFANVAITDSITLPPTVILSTISASTISALNYNGGAATLSSLNVGGPVHLSGGGGNLYIDNPACFVSSNLVYASSMTTTNISSIKNFNSYNSRAIQNPGNIFVYSVAKSFGSGTGTIDIDTRNFVPGVYTVSAVCTGNNFRNLDATFYYTNSSTQYCWSANGMDNYNGVYWYAYPGYLRFVSQTDGPGDSFTFNIYMISGRITAVGDDPPMPEPSTVTSTLISTNGGTFTPTIIGLSTMKASTLGFVNELNAYFTAGSVSTPTFLSTGNIQIQAAQTLGLYGNSLITGAVANTTILSGASTIIQGVYPSGVILLDSDRITSKASTITETARKIDLTASTLTLTGDVKVVGVVNTSSIVGLSSINGVAYPPAAAITSTYTNLYTSSISGNPLNYLALVANRTVTTTSLSSIFMTPAGYFSGDVRVSSLNGVAPGGGGGGWVSTATTALNMGSYPINGNALTINSATSGDFTIKNAVGSNASLNLIADTYAYVASRQYDIYFDPHTDVGGNAPGSCNFGGNNFYANSYQAMYFTQYGTSGYGMNFQSGDRIFMNSATQFTAKCTGYFVELNGLGGVQIVDSNTGGSGMLTVDSSNHLYWNGTFIA